MEKLAYLASTIAIADFKPADQYVEVYEKLHAEWSEVQQSWVALKDGEVVTMREKLIETGPLIVGAD